MIPNDQLEKRAQAIYNDIGHALVYVDGVPQEGVINKTTIDGTLVKVFVALSAIQGMIERVEIYDKDGDLLQTQELSVHKLDHYKFMCVVQIKVEGGWMYDA